MKEYITDKEKRLLFSALRREEDVCRKIDESSSENDQTELVPIVKSLQGKFYYDRMIKQIRKDAVKEFVSLISEEMPGKDTMETLQHAMDKFI